MKLQDVPTFKQKVLDMLPVTQAEVWKNLGIGHRDGSSLIGLMVKESLIKKTKQDNTFLLEKIGGNGHDKEKKKKDYSVLLSKSGKFTPCSGCELNCVPTTCEKLTAWLLD